MNEVFCHHPSLIHGRDDRCPDCGQKIGVFSRPSPSQPADNSPPRAWNVWVETRRSPLLRLLFAIGFLACSGCAPYDVFPSHVREGINHKFDMARWRMLPNETPPVKIELGGRIIEAQTKNGTVTIVTSQLPIVHHPAYGPKKGKSKGEFVITFQGTIEPLFLQPGNRLIVVGTTDGTRLIEVDDILRRLPTVKTECIHLWKTGDVDIADFASSGAGYGALEEETFCTAR